MLKCGCFYHRRPNGVSRQQSLEEEGDYVNDNDSHTPVAFPELPQTRFDVEPISWPSPKRVTSFGQMGQPLPSVWRYPVCPRVFRKPTTIESITACLVMVDMSGSMGCAGTTGSCGDCSGLSRGKTIGHYAFELAARITGQIPTQNVKVLGHTSRVMMCDLVIIPVKAGCYPQAHVQSQDGRENFDCAAWEYGLSVLPANAVFIHIGDGKVYPETGRHLQQIIGRAQSAGIRAVHIQVGGDMEPYYPADLTLVCPDVEDSEERIKAARRVVDFLG